MSQRFQIEDLVIQDSSGVVFRAVDSETQQIVAVRRFFPFGANGGGLDAAEQGAYEIAVTRLAGIAHPALRGVICGDCDPVDGMPFIVTEWVEGTRLQSILERGPLAPAEAVKLLTRALDVCGLLSEVLAEEAVWVETELQSIIVGAESTARGFTFSIAPLKWLGKNDGQRGLESIVTLTEEILDWRGKIVSDQAANGLGGWLKWLRRSAKTTTLHEAREKLAAAIGVGPPLPVRNLVRQATRPLVVTKRPPKKKSRLPLVTISLGVLLAISLCGWALIQRNQSLNTLPPPAAALVVTPSEIYPPPIIARAPEPNEPIPAAPPAVVTETIPGESRQDRASRVAAEMTAAAARAGEDSAANAARIATAFKERGGILTIADQELLLAQKGREVTLEGTLQAISHSSSKATMYLLFSKNPATTEARVSVLLKNAPADLAEDPLAPLIGRKIRVKGKVRIENFGKRPEILIKTRAAIQEVR